MSNQIKTGKDSVVIGDVTGTVGDGSVVIGPTDERGNTIITQPMAVGRGAKAGPGSIAIGAGASADSNLFHLLDQLKSIPEIQTDTTLLATIDTFSTELQMDEPQQNTIQSLWTVIKASATMGGAIGLIEQISEVLGF